MDLVSQCKRIGIMYRISNFLTLQTISPTANDQVKCVTEKQAAAPLSHFLTFSLSHPLTLSPSH
ncbi:MAG TPA: hypothetical protein PK858_09390, partial [Saprospiraceae bacterium]|nr:hypothetical protein [Saprospiraceae bacterium]